MLRASWLSISAPLVLVACGGDVATSAAAAGAGGATSSGSATSASGGATSSAASGGGMTSSSTGPLSSANSGGGCGTCMTSFICCGIACVNPQNDIHNCGGCGIDCGDGAFAYCDKGKCGTPPCTSPAGCGAAGLCCADQCCKPGEICCTVPGPVGDTTACTPPTADLGSCPPGCTDCKCTSPDTPIATPDGERPIASLRAGDLVYSVDGGALRAVPVAAVLRVPASHHRIVRLVLASGRVLEVSPLHPTADGRTFADLHAGDRLDGVAIVEAATLPYAHDATYDILPASDTGTYVAGGVVIGSTLHGRDVAR